MPKICIHTLLVFGAGPKICISTLFVLGAGPQRCIPTLFVLSVNLGVSESWRTGELIGFLNFSSKQLQIMEQTAKIINAGYLSRKGDCINRWNSTYEMIDRVIKLMPIFTLLFIQREEFKKK